MATEITHVVICCMDPRLTAEMRNHMAAKMNAYHWQVAEIRSAGGVKHMFDDPTRMGGQILQDAELAVTLGAHTIVVVTHTDCGAYKHDPDNAYVEAFTSPDADKELQIAELNDAYTMLINHFHGQIKIVPILALLEEHGVHLIII